MRLLGDTRGLFAVEGEKEEETAARVGEGGMKPPPPPPPPPMVKLSGAMKYRGASPFRGRVDSTAHWAP